MDSAGDRRLEITARAVRDLLADTLVTLPTLIERDAVPSLHFWFATFSGLRRELFPRLRRPRGTRGQAGAGMQAMREAVEAGREHWLRVAREMAADPQAARAIRARARLDHPRLKGRSPRGRAAAVQPPRAMSAFAAARNSSARDSSMVRRMSL